MTKTELKKQQTREVIELLEREFEATDFENDQGSYFTFFIGNLEGSLMRRDFDVSMYNNMRMGPGFTDEEYAIRDAAKAIEDEINKEIQKYLKKYTS